MVCKRENRGILTISMYGENVLCDREVKKSSCEINYI